MAQSGPMVDMWSVCGDGFIHYSTANRWVEKVAHYDTKPAWRAAW